MVIEISEFYKKKGFNKAYVVTNKDNRRMTILRKPSGYMTTISYDKYIYTSYYKVEIPKGDQIDHIDGDKTNDTLSNLQVISQGYNIRKDHRSKVMLEMVCPICGRKFLFEKRNLSTHPNPTCSRRCGGIKSHMK